MVLVQMKLLRRIFFGLALVLWAGVTSAAIYPVVEYKGAENNWYSSKSEACASIVAYINRSAQYQWHVVSSEPNCKRQNAYNIVDAPYEIRSICVADSTLNNGQCV